MGIFYSNEKHPTELEYHTDKSLQHLKQGKVLLENRKQYNNIEGFTSGDSTQSLINQLEDLHNKLESEMQQLKRYQQEYHTVLDNYQQRIANQYSGKLVDNGSKKYYITKYGIYREFEDGAYESRKCLPGATASKDVAMSGLPGVQGESMKAYSRCGNEGENIEYSGKRAYIDMGGIAHEYPDGLTRDDVANCPMNSSNVSKEVWEDYMKDKGEPMTKDHLCLASSINKELFKKFNKSRKDVGELVKQINQYTQNNVIPETQDARNDLNKNKQLITKYMTTLKSATNHAEVPATYHALNENTNILQRYRYYWYLFYIISFVILLFVLMHLGIGLGTIRKQISKTTGIINKGFRSLI